MVKAMTRRGFLGKMLSGLFVFCAGWSQRSVWPTCGSEKGSVRLVFYTDVHARKEWETPAAMARAAEVINKQKADLVIAGGDFITEGFEFSSAKAAPRWDVYMKMHRAIKGDLCPVIGNHDLVAAAPRDGTLPAKDPRAVYKNKMGLDRTYYSFDAVGYHFVVLDSIQITGDEYEYEGMIWPEQLEWLKQDLSQVPRGRPIIMATHMPLLTAFYTATRGPAFTPTKNRVVVNNLDILRIIREHNVILVLQGHLHAKELLMWRDTTFILGGAISGKWWRGPWHGTEEGFNVITLTESHVDWQYIGYGWEARRPLRGQSLPPCLTPANGHVFASLLSTQE